MYICWKHQGLINRTIGGQKMSRIPQQLPPRKFQEQRRHVVNYEKKEDLSCIMMVVIPIGACHIFCFIFDCTSCVFICMIW